MGEEAVKEAHTFLMSFNEAIIYAKRKGRRQKSHNVLEHELGIHNVEIKISCPILPCEKQVFVGKVNRKLIHKWI